MDKKCKIFCKRALERKLIEDSQVNILRAMCPEEGTIEDLLKIVVEFDVISDHEAVEKLAEEIDKVPTDDDMTMEDHLLLATTEKEVSGDTMGLDWFCFFAISEGALTREIALGLAAEIEDLSDVLAFAQAVVDHWLSDDYSLVQKCIDKAFVMKKHGRKPPFSVFS